MIRCIPILYLHRKHFGSSPTQTVFLAKPQLADNGCFVFVGGGTSEGEDCSVFAVQARAELPTPAC